mgnify:CR=1 FL=1|jgi:uncharacterized membrane protein
MIENSMQVLAEKMRLESQWNTSYLQNGRITADMNVLHERIRILRRKLIQLDTEEAGFSFKALDNVEETLSVAT